MKTSLLNQLSKEITQGEWCARKETVRINDGTDVLTIDIKPIVPIGSYRGEITRLQDSTCLGVDGIGVSECEANAHAISLTPQLIREVLELREFVAMVKRDAPAGWDEAARSLLARHETTN